MGAHQIRISRAVSDLPRATKAYVDGLGMSLLWETTGNDGSPHALLGYPDAPWHLDLSTPPAVEGQEPELTTANYFRNLPRVGEEGTKETELEGKKEKETSQPRGRPRAATSTIPAELSEPQPLGTAAALDVLFSLYIPDATEWSNRCTAMTDAGWEEVEPVSQYVTLPEYTFRDPDGHRIVLMLAGWDSQAIMDVSNEMKKLSAGGNKLPRGTVTEV